MVRVGCESFKSTKMMIFEKRSNLLIETLRDDIADQFHLFRYLDKLHVAAAIVIGG